MPKQTSSDYTDSSLKEKAARLGQLLDTHMPQDSEALPQSSLNESTSAAQGVSEASKPSGAARFSTGPIGLDGTFLQDTKNAPTAGFADNSAASAGATQTGAQAQKRKVNTIAGLFAFGLVIALAAGIVWANSTWGTPGSDGSGLRPFANRQDQRAASGAAEARGQFRNGPYTEVHLQDVIDHRMANIDYDPDKLLVVNVNHPLKISYLANLYKVPFEQAKANPQAGQAYKLLNIAVDKQFGSPIDLERAYIDPNSAEGELPSNVDNTMGLAIDLRAPNYKSENFLNSPKGSYIFNNAAHWGFILRYPAKKEAETGRSFIPNKFRYVGHPHASIIQSEHLSLDEYPEFLGVDTELEHNGYVVCRQKGPLFKIPAHASSVDIAPDNTGYYIVTSCMLAPETVQEELNSIPKRTDGGQPPKRSETLRDSDTADSRRSGTKNDTPTNKKPEDKARYQGNKASQEQNKQKEGARPSDKSRSSQSPSSRSTN